MVMPGRLETESRRRALRPAGRAQAIRRDPSSVGAHLADPRVQMLLQAVVMQRTPEEMRHEQVRRPLKPLQRPCNAGVKPARIQ